MASGLGTDLLSKRLITIGTAASFSLLIPLLGYVYLGGLVACLFAIGYVGGFMAWVVIPNRPSWERFKSVYWLALGAFLILHKAEENRTEFFRVLGEKITGVPVPVVTPTLVASLLILPLVAWAMVPYLMKRDISLGYYLAWTFMASMGFTESAHFVFPLFTNEPYGYFPGMASAAVIVPIGWWGMRRLAEARD